MTKRILPTPEQLRELLTYDPETGKLFWKERPRVMFKNSQAHSAWNTKYQNRTALESINGNGYRHGTINAKSYAAHRVAWAVYYGEWPIDQIDHINGNRADNRIENMRIADSSQNQHNQGKMKNNTSGYKGVTFDKRFGKWYANISTKRRNAFLGSFNTPEAAHAAYCEAAKKYHGEFARFE